MVGRVVEENAYSCECVLFYASIVLAYALSKRALENASYEQGLKEVVEKKYIYRNSCQLMYFDIFNAR